MEQPRLLLIPLAAMVALLLGTLAAALWRREPGGIVATWGTLLHSTWVSAAFDVAVLSVVWLGVRGPEGAWDRAGKYAALVVAIIAGKWLFRLAAK